ncbi:MAG: cytochrome c [Deltaproteobacteria bacterium]|nr:cytochrome c [Deltaproteobacteria bacterium]
MAKSSKSSPSWDIQNPQVRLAAVTIGLGVLALALGFFWLPGGKQRPSPQMVAQGKSIYEANCQVCHGPNAQGQDPSQPKGGMIGDRMLAPALNHTGHAMHHPMKDLKRVILEGGSAPESPMRAVAGRLTSDQANAVMAYFMNLWPDDVWDYYHANINK